MAEGQSPLAQFEIKTLVPIEMFGVNASFTNSSLFMVLTVITVSLFLIGGMRRSAMALRRIPPIRNRLTVITVSTINSDEFVKDALTPNISIGTNVLISNCASGDCPSATSIYPFFRRLFNFISLRRIVFFTIANGIIHTNGHPINIHNPGTKA